MYKLIAIDLDGTLLNSYGEITDENKITNIVSNKKAVISKIIVQNGTARVNVGDEVNESDILSTGFKSEARLNYNGSIISLAALTRIEFSELKTIGKKDIVDFNVSMGAVRSKVSRVDRDPPDYRARTSVAVASVRGTDFVVFANGKVVCYEGKVAVIPIALFNEYSNIITDKKLLIND